MTIILQGNPDCFDIDNYLSQHDYVYWSVKRQLEELKDNTPVFIWRAGEQAGVIAYGKVAERPCEIEKVQRPEDLGKNLWKTEPDDPSAKKVGIAIDEVRLNPDEGMLLRSDLEKNTIFMKATIITAPRGTVFELSENEYQYLSQQWQEARCDGRQRNVLAGITRDAIIAAINECDSLGREMFLQQYGYEKTRSYFLSYEKKLYDSNAIIGVAHKYIGDGNKPLTPNAFSGGEVSIASRLRSLEFDVPKGVLDHRRNPFLDNYHSWVCSQEGGLTRGPRGVEKRLAKILGSNVQNILTSGDDNGQRYPAFVAVRWGFAEIVNDILVPTEKWKHKEEYDKYGEFKGTEQTIEKDHFFEKTVQDDIDSMHSEEDQVFVEGQQKQRFINYYERDSGLRTAAIREHGVTCMACGFNFGAAYGERGQDYIEVHHLRLVSTLEGASQINPKTDMVVVCSNCHRMIHRRKDNVLTLDDLKSILNNTHQEQYHQP